LLLTNRGERKSYENYEILPVQNLTKDRLCSIQAKYNLENEQKKFLEKQLSLTKKKISKAKTHRTESLVYEENENLSTRDVEQQVFNRFETQHFLMKNRLTKHIFQRTLNILSLKFNQKRLSKLVD
jgi:exonuclease I